MMMGVETCCFDWLSATYNCCSTDKIYHHERRRDGEFLRDPHGCCTLAHDLCQFGVALIDFSLLPSAEFRIEGSNAIIALVIKAAKLIQFRSFASRTY